MTDSLAAIPEALHDFLTYLQNNGFPCGVGERVRAVRVIEHNRAESQPDRWKSLLCPIFARSQAEQERFRQAFTLFFQKTGRAEAPPPPAGELRLSPPPASAPQRQGLRLRRGPVLSALAASVLLTAFLMSAIPGRIVTLARAVFASIPPPPLPSPPRPQAGVYPPSSAGADYKKIEADERVQNARACRGVECVASGWRPWAILAPAFLALLAEAFRRTRVWRNVQFRGREQTLEPPMSWPPVATPPRFGGYRDLLVDVAAVMNQRIAADAIQLDIAGTIRKTIAAAGYPQPVFRTRRILPSYLFLIEQRTAGDHFAAWWTAIAAELRGFGVQIDCYYFGGDLSRCRPAGGSLTLPTGRLLDLYPSHAVVVLGDPGSVLNPFTGDLSSWAETLRNRDNRAVLTPSASFEWGRSEQNVRRHFPLFPARVRYLPAMLKTFDAAGVLAATAVESDEIAAIPDSVLPELDEEPDSAWRPALKQYLDPDVFDWLCACAVYPELYWELTIELGRLIHSAETLFTEAKLLQLVRLKWFRQGAIPGFWRAWLVGQLDSRMASKVREFLVHAMQENPAPKESFARDWQQLQIAAQRHWLAPADPEKRATLELAMDRLPESDVGRDYLLRKLRAGWKAAPAARKLAAVPQREWRRLAAGSWKTVAAGLIVAVTAAAFVARVPEKEFHTVRKTVGWEVVPNVQRELAVNFAPSPALTPELRQSLQRSFETFRAYLESIGFRAAGRPPTFVIDPKMDMNSYFTFDANEIHTAPELAPFQDVVLHDYIHYALHVLNQALSLAQSLSGLQEGLADYFPSSFSGRSDFGRELWDLFKKRKPSTVLPSRDLNNKQQFTDGNVEAHLEGTTWGGAFWELRQTIGQDIIDPLLLSAWKNLNAQGKAPGRVSFVLELIRQDQIRFGGAHGAAIRTVFANRGLPVSPAKAY